MSAVEAFAKALAMAIPSGKQNSFAAHNPPEFVGACLRRGTPLNLANAFERPVSSRVDQALTTQSVERLAEYESRLAAVYGGKDDRWLSLDLTERWPTGRGEQVASLEALAVGVRSLASDALGI